jgi:hypothetical protein
MGSFRFSHSLYNSKQIHNNQPLTTSIISPSHHHTTTKVRAETLLFWATDGTIGVNATIHGRTTDKLRTTDELLMVQ